MCPAKVRPEEEWARAVIAVELGLAVEVNDDGSANSMYDLRIGPAGAPQAAIEVTRANDETWLGTWKAGPSKGAHTCVGVQGNWVAVVAPGASIKRLNARLPDVLRRLESEGEVVGEPGTRAG